MKQLRLIRFIINSIIDWLYPHFSRLLPKETFKYAFCGGINTIGDLFLYFITYNFILGKDDLNLYLITISPHIAAFLIVFPITFSTGFILSRYITFTQSEIRGRIQLFRYWLIVMGSIVLNYIFLKIFVEICHIYPTPSKFLTTGIVIVYSYFAQRHFSFATANTN